MLLYESGKGLLTFDTIMRRVCCIGVLLLLAGTAGAGTIILKIMATNPIDKPQPVPIRANLPAGIGTNEIVSAGGLDVAYDVNSGTYYVHKEVTLGPKDTVSFPVEIRDIWFIPTDELDSLEQHAAGLLAKLKDTDHHEVAGEAAARVMEDLEAVRTRQDENAISSGAKAVDHIRAFEANEEVLKSVKILVGRLENLVLGTRQDPGKILGEVAAVELPSRKVNIAPDAYGTAIIRFSIHNPSPSQVREVSDYRRELPSEIDVSDILDAGGLAVSRNPKTGVTVLTFPELKIEPSDTVVLNVRVRDKWNINTPRVTDLRARTEELLSRIGENQLYESVGGVLQGVLGELSEVESGKGPETLNDRYIAFYRVQAKRLDELEQRLIRIETALRPVEKTTRVGFDVKAPSMKTTWLVIYIILGFLMVVSLLFFFRWYGRSKAEKMDES